MRVCFQTLTGVCSRVSLRSARPGSATWRARIPGYDQRNSLLTSVLQHLVKTSDFEVAVNDFCQAMKPYGRSARGERVREKGKQN